MVFPLTFKSLLSSIGMVDSDLIDLEVALKTKEKFAITRSKSNIKIFIQEKLCQNSRQCFALPAFSILLQHINGCMAYLSIILHENNYYLCCQVHRVHPGVTELIFFFFSFNQLITHLTLQVYTTTAQCSYNSTHSSACYILILPHPQQPNCNPLNMVGSSRVLLGCATPILLVNDKMLKILRTSASVQLLLYLK